MQVANECGIYQAEHFTGNNNKLNSNTANAINSRVGMAQQSTLHHLHTLRTGYIITVAQKSTGPTLRSKFSSCIRLTAKK